MKGATLMNASIDSCNPCNPCNPCDPCDSGQSSRSVPPHARAACAAAGVLFVFLALSSLSCASSQPSGAGAGPTGTATAASTAAPGGPPSPPWKEMNKDQRMGYMKQVVFPKMKDEFSAFNAHYSDMTCKTCHGDGATDGTFKMPSPQLPKLPSPGHPEAFQKIMAEKPQVMEFMAKKVKPGMAQLLGLPEFNPQTNSGEFGCFNCHTHD
jgi:hypothetical protein